MYPQIVIDLKKYQHNLQYLLDLVHQKNMTLMAVSKVFCADQKIINIMNEEKVDFIADSRIENLESMDTKIPKVLLRIPMLSEVEKVVKYSNISLNSELETIVLLDKASQELNVKHDVILMIDLGDLREGIFNENEVYKTINAILQLNAINLRGIGTNLTCYGGVIPTEETLKRLVEYKTQIEDRFNITLDIISGGNSSNLTLLLQNQIPEEINNIRLGEAIVLGRETAFGDYLDQMYTDIFTLKAEIVEIKDKPSIPIGTIGMNAFGKVPIFKDKGEIRRAIIAIGAQDVDHTELIPYDTIEAIGSSSDHIILDVTDSINDYKVGDIISFRLTYSSILSLMTSKYVKKVYKDVS
ncbi:MAG: ornithine racemase Orr [Candidatus Izemoplasmataceae bacterium]